MLVELFFDWWIDISVLLKCFLLKKIIIMLEYLWSIFMLKLIYKNFKDRI